MADSLHRGRVGVDVIALLALAGALAVGEYLAAAVVSVMLASGRALEAWAGRRARRDLHALLDRAPRTARRYTRGTLETLPLEAIDPGDRLLVAPGEVVPVDGTVTRAPAVLDESALTGEPLPVERSQDSRSAAERSTPEGPSTWWRRPGRLTVPTPGSSGWCRKRKSQTLLVWLADRYALWFLLVTVAAAAAAWALAGPSRAVAVLVVATPCPLILAAPVALVSGLSVAARRGVLVKGGAVLERLAQCSTLLLDKTGH